MWLPAFQGGKSPTGGLFLSSTCRGARPSADCILHLAGGLVRLAFGLQLGIAGQLSGRFLDGALRLLRRALDTILVHCLLLVDVKMRPIQFRDRAAARQRQKRVSARTTPEAG
jgi:hypothetical protein